MGSGSNGPLGHVGHHCERQSVRSGDGGLFSRRTEACPLPDKTALALADAFFQHIVCRFGMPDHGREFEKKMMQELCLLCGSHKTRTTPYHSPYRLMFGEECTLSMDIGLPRQEPDLLDPISSPYAVWVCDALEVVYDP